jgi:hypothetical protein
MKASEQKGKRFNTEGTEKKRRTQRKKEDSPQRRRGRRDGQRQKILHRGDRGKAEKNLRKAK